MAAPPSEPRRSVDLRLEARVRARAVGDEGPVLDVALVIDGRELVREVWRPAGRPRVRLVACPSRHDLAAGELTLDLEVRGRPHAVLVRVDAARPEAYRELAGLAQYEVLGPLPVGRHRIRWALQDRSFAAPQLQPGEYVVRVASEPDEVGLALPGRDDRGGGPWSPPHLLRLEGAPPGDLDTPVWSAEDEEGWELYGDPAAPWPIAGDPPAIDSASETGPDAEARPASGPETPWPARARRAPGSTP